MVGKDNCSHVSIHKLEAGGFSLSSLYKRYVNSYSEVSSKELSDTGIFKQLTGGDDIEAEFKNKNAFNFQNHAKLIYACNTVPRAEDDTCAFWRRWVIIDFPNKFTGDKEDKNLIDKLTTEEEMSGILNMALAGLKILLMNCKFTNEDPDEVTRERYIRKSDSVLSYAMDQIEPDPESFVIKNDMYEDYQVYCGKKKYIAVTDSMFFKRCLGGAVAIEPCFPTVGGKQVKAWRGIKFKNRMNVREDKWYSEQTQSGSKIDGNCDKSEEGWK